MRPFHYLAYGLHIVSDFEIPEYRFAQHVAALPADVTIRFTNDIAEAPPDDATTDLISHSAQEAIFWYPQFGRFTVRNGAQIDIEALPTCSPADTRPFLLGGLMGMALFQRGKMVLHGSTVEKNGLGVSIVGHKGAGKSTLTAYLCQHGFNLVSDDVTAIERIGDEMRVVPSVPQIRLWPEAVAALGHDAEALDMVHPRIDKRNLYTTETFAKDECALQAVFVLGRAAECTVEMITGAARLVTLLPHVYVARWPALHNAYAFTQGAEIATHIPVYKLHYPRAFDQLAHAHHQIETVLASG